MFDLQKLVNLKLTNVSFTEQCMPADVFSLYSIFAFMSITTTLSRNQEQIASGVYLLHLNRPEFFKFKAGQHIALSLPGEEGQHRIYSIASGENEKTLSILYDVKSDGYLTPLMERLKKGAEMRISKASGSFLWRNIPAYWIASGTGIAPFISMLRSGYYAGAKLVHGGRNQENFYFEDEFTQAFGADYVRCASRDNRAADFTGRVTNWIRAQNDLPKEHLYYLCGRAEMVVECRDLLIEKQIPFNQIIAEIYF